MFDYLSPYAYLGWHGVRRACQSRGVPLEPLPVLFPALLNQWGTKGPAETPVKARFVFLDAARRAQLHGLPFHAPRLHPFRPLLPLRLSLVEVAGDDQAKVIDALFGMAWGAGGDPSNEDEVRAALDAAGLDGSGLVQRSKEEPAKAALRRNTEAAIELGVFGVPTTLVDDDFYWGSDQLALIEAQLDGETPVRPADLADRLPTGVGATRTQS